MSQKLVDISPETWEVLSGMEQKLGTNDKAEIIRRAIGLLNFALDQRAEGWEIILERGSKRKNIINL